MGKIKRYRDVHVKIFPYLYYSTNEGDEAWFRKVRSDLNAVIEFIRECMANPPEGVYVPDIGGMEVDWEMEEVCEFCGMKWGEDPETGEPICCSNAYEEWIREKEKEDRERERYLTQEED